MIEHKMQTNINNKNEYKTISKKNRISARIWELDALRGFCILLMVIDHFLITLFINYGFKWYGYGLLGDSGMAKFCRGCLWYYNCVPRTIIHPIIVFFFIGLCGLSCGFSRNNFKRGIQLAIISLLVTLVTLAYNESNVIVFGILHLLSLCIITWSLIQITTKNNKTAQLITGITISFIIGILYFVTIKNPALDQKLGNSLFILTYTSNGIGKSPGDFFSVIPWSGVFFLCAGLTSVIYPTKKSIMPKLNGNWNKFLCFFGRHTLLIYCLHQIVFFIIFELISYMFITKGQFIYL